MFKKGDVVYYHSNDNDVGVVEQAHEAMPARVWVNWTSGPRVGELLHCGIDEISFHKVEPPGRGYYIAAHKAEQAALFYGEQGMQSIEENLLQENLLQKAQELFQRQTNTA